MPFTPFHMGAALLGKGLSPSSQSILFFGACQVAIDLEPAIKMAMGYTGSLHSITHNPIGMLLTVALCAAIWLWAQQQTWWGRGMPVLSRTTIFDTAWWAVLSHFLLDLMSHTDMGYSVSSRFGIEDAEGLSAAFGIVGLVLLGIRWLIAKIIGGVQALQTRNHQSYDRD